LFATPLIAVIILIVGIGLVGVGAQSDAATRSDAFWASRPFHPSAVAASKIVLAIVVVLTLPCVALAFGLVAFGTPASEVVAMTLWAALSYAMYIAVALAVAGVTADLRDFGIGYIGMIVATVLVDSALLPGAMVKSMLHSAFARDAAETLAIVLSVALIVYAYRRRHVGGRIWVWVFGITLLASLPIAGDAPPFARVNMTTFVKPTLRLETFAVPARVGPGRYLLRVVAEGGPQGARLAISPDQFTIHLRNGETIRPSGVGLGTVIGRGHLPIGDSVAWVETSDQNVDRTGQLISVQVTDDAWQKILKGVARVEVDGEVTAYVPTRIAELSTDGSQLVRLRGARVKVVGTDVGGFGSATVSVLGFGISASAFGFGLGRVDDPTVVAVNPADKDAVQLANRETSAENSGWFLIPGVTLQERRQRAGMPTSRERGGAPIRDETWWRGARLEVFAWQTAKRYPVHLELNIPPA
jgi:hypothetical protein